MTSAKWLKLGALITWGCCTFWCIYQPCAGYWFGTRGADVDGIEAVIDLVGDMLTCTGAMPLFFYLMGANLWRLSHPPTPGIRRPFWIRLPTLAIALGLAQLSFNVIRDLEYLIDDDHALIWFARFVWLTLGWVGALGCVQLMRVLAALPASTEADMTPKLRRYAAISLLLFFFALACSVVLILPLENRMEGVLMTMSQNSFLEESDRLLLDFLITLAPLARVCGLVLPLPLFIFSFQILRKVWHERRVS